jgi:hypothetical protein
MLQSALETTLGKLRRRWVGIGAVASVPLTDGFAQIVTGRFEADH